jgi:hypothetical protein
VRVRAFEIDPDKDGQLFGIMPDGSRQLVGLTESFRDISRTGLFGSGIVSGEPRKRLSEMTPAELGGLWGISLNRRNEEDVGGLAAIDPERTCVEVWTATEVEPEKKMPPLPTNLRYLVYHGASADGVADAQRLKEMESLRLLVWQAYGEWLPDASLFQGLAGLRFLDVGCTHSSRLAALKGLRALKLEGYDSGEDISFISAMPALRELHVWVAETKDHPVVPPHPRLEYLDICSSSEFGDTLALGGLPALKSLEINCPPVKRLLLEKDLAVLQTLNLRYVNSEMADVSFVRRMPALKRLMISGTEIADLSSLQGHRSIEFVAAKGCPIKSLPNGAIPTLKTLNVLGTELDDAAVAAFEKANPQCRVVFHWEKAFREAVAETNRIRIRTGSVCCRDPSREKTLLEVTEPAEIRRFIDFIRINEAKSGGWCLCCGEPSFEFRNGGRVLAMIGLKHATTLQWREWVGEGMLTDESADALCQWLADHRIKRPLKGRRSAKAIRDAPAEAQRRGSIPEIIPQAVVEAILKNKQVPDDRSWQLTLEVAAAFEDSVPDPRARFLLYMRLFAMGENERHDGGLSDANIIRVLMKPIANEDILAAMPQALADAVASRGVAKWLLVNEGFMRFSEKELEPHMPAIAQCCMGQRNTVRLLLAIIAYVRSPNMVPVLREIAGGTWKMPLTSPPAPQQPSTPSLEEPGIDEIVEARAVQGSNDQDPEEGLRVRAAALLAQMNDLESLPILRKLVGKSEGFDRAYLQPFLDKMEADAIRKQEAGSR